MIRTISMIALVALISACSSSQPGYAEKSAANDQEYAKLDENKNMVCEYKAETGSHRKKRTCMSKELADEIRKRNQAVLRRQEHKGQTSTSGGGS